MNAIAYNLTRSIMQQSAHRHDVPLDRISYKGTLDSMRHLAAPIHAARPRARAKLYDQMLELIARDLVPWRPNRTEPQVRKRRPKNFPLMSQPRASLRRKMRYSNAAPTGSLGLI